MTNFYVNGRLEAARGCFRAPLTPDAVEWVAQHGSPTTPMNARLVLERLAPDDPLHAPWERMLERALATDAATTLERHSAAEAER